MSYLPVDEDHPTLATDAYSFSKQIMERIGCYFWERDAVSGTILRLPGVFTHDRVVRGTDHYGDDLRAGIQGILELPAGDRSERVRELHAAYDRFRSSNRLDKVKGGYRGLRRAWRRTGMKVAEAVLMDRVANLFAYIDELDSAQAIERSLIGDYDGCHVLFVNARRNGVGMPTEDLAKLYWPDVGEIREQVDGDDCLVSIDRARKVIGFEPEWVIEP